MLSAQTLALLDGRSGDAPTLGEVLIELFSAQSETAAAEDGPPTRIQIFPKGPKVKARAGDGREFTIEDPEEVVRRTQAQGFDLPIDIDHGTELFFATDKSAYGWIPRKSLQVIDGAIYGDPEFNTAGAMIVQERRYRYGSPAMMVSRVEGSEARKIDFFTSFALTNKPALRMRALASSQQQLVELLESQRLSGEETRIMLKAILSALGLAEAATEQDAVQAIQKLRERPAEQLPSLDKFVPRGDFDAAVARATTAEDQIAKLRQEQRESEIEAAISEAIKAEKIDPAGADFYRETCRQDGGVERFKAFIEQRPSMRLSQPVAPAASPTPGAATASSMSVDEIAVARSLGMTDEQWIESRKGVARPQEGVN